MSNNQKANKPIEFEFFNRTKSIVNVWVEPTCVQTQVHSKVVKLEVDKAMDVSTEYSRLRLACN